MSKRKSYAPEGRTSQLIRKEGHFCLKAAISCVWFLKRKPIGLYKACNVKRHYKTHDKEKYNTSTQKCRTNKFCKEKCFINLTNTSSCSS